jgi:hypothetical protein
MTADNKTPRSTAALRQAIAEFDAGQELRDALWMSAMNDDDCTRLEAEEAAALRLVQEAFYELTSDRNNRDDRYQVPLKFMRKTAELEWL